MSTSFFKKSGERAMDIRMIDVMARKKRKGSDFGKRLARLRKARGLTQTQLAEAIGSTLRAISYYENESDYPPAPVIVDLARALKVSWEELMGLKKTRIEKEDPETRRLWKKFQQLRKLPERDKRAIIRMINSLIVANSKVQ